MNPLGLTVLKLERALEIKRQIESLEDELRKVIAAEESDEIGGMRSRTKGRISEAGRRRIAAAQRARWARYKRSQSQAGKPRRRRPMSAAARAKIGAAQKRRWAATKA